VIVCAGTDNSGQVTKYKIISKGTKTKKNGKYLAEQKHHGSVIFYNTTPNRETKRLHCQSTYNYLHQLHPVVRTLSVEARKTVVQAFVSSRLDCYNSLFSGVTNS